jgi:quercetin dioxygenase-like cupin family protein
MRTAIGILIACFAATAAATPPPPDVIEIEAAQVRAAFEKGMPLLENDAYKIHASRREAPGQAEIHLRDTDLIYVLDGAATFVTGGSVVHGRTVAADEIRGASIEGGATRRLEKGDVFVVPNGVPHWFQSVSGPLFYYVVKVRSGYDAARPPGQQTPGESQ